VKTISYTFFVSATEYPKLQAACPEEFPFDYAEFCARVERSIRDAAAGNVVVEKVYVSVEKFLAWCAEAGVQPGNISRARYATAIGYPWGET
jgi:hypothetical protein